MKRLVAVSLALFAVALLFVSPTAQENRREPAPPPSQGVEFIFVSTPRGQDRGMVEQVMQTDEDFRRAKLAADRGALARLVSDDYIGINQTGNTRDKQQLLDLFEWFRIDSLVTNRANVRFSGETAIVTGEQTENSATGNDRMLFTRVYTRKSGQWQLLSSTQFRDPRAPETAAR
jgi:hypothetical protein